MIKKALYSTLTLIAFLSLNLSSFAQTKKGKFVKIFDGKSHFICGEPGWEKVADYIIDWYEKL